MFVRVAVATFSLMRAMKTILFAKCSKRFFRGITVTLGETVYDIFGRQAALDW